MMSLYLQLILGLWKLFTLQKVYNYIWIKHNIVCLWQPSRWWRNGLLLYYEYTSHLQKIIIPRLISLWIHV